MGTLYLETGAKVLRRPASHPDGMLLAMRPQGILLLSAQYIDTYWALAVDTSFKSTVHLPSFREPFGPALGGTCPNHLRHTVTDKLELPIILVLYLLNLFRYISDISGSNHTSQKFSSTLVFHGLSRTFQDEFVAGNRIENTNFATGKWLLSPDQY
jgi:hypothetical protein